jgi:tetratricopeptide (TPR) repeat protein
VQVQVSVKFGVVLGRTLVAGLAALAFLGTSAFLQSQTPDLQRLLSHGQAASEAGDYVTAVANFEAACNLAPDNLAANRGLVLSYVQAGRPAEAAQLGSKAVARWPKDAQLQHWLGLAYFKQQMNAQALESLRRSEALDASQFGTHFDTSLVLLSEQQYGPAGDELEKAIRLNPSDALAHVLLGRAYQNSNRTLKGVQQFQEALRINPSLPLVHYHLGFAYSSLGHVPEAIVEYKKELARSPENFDVVFQLGHSLLETGDWNSAVTHLKRAVDLDPQNSDAAYDLGKALLLAGNVSDSVTMLRRSVDSNPANAGAHYQLARAFDKLGRKDDAEQERQRFAELKKAQSQSGGMASGRSQ